MSMSVCKENRNGLWEKWIRSFKSKQKRWTHYLFHMWNIPIIFMGFLLGRAMILETVSPFAIAFLGVMIHLKRKAWLLIWLSLVSGASTLDVVHSVRIACFLTLFLLIQKVFTWVGKGQINYVPFVVLASSAVGHLILIWWSGFSVYQLMLSTLDILLSWILSLIFIHSLPLVTVKKKRLTLRPEEIVCLVILVGSVMTGTMGWFVWDLSIVHIVSRYIVLVLAFVGGAMLGSSMGVVTGIILSLSDPKAMLEISLLAFAGLLAGLMKEGKKIGVSFGFLFGSLMLNLYDGTEKAIWISFWESLVSILLFWLTPQFVYQSIAKIVPGTSENQVAHYDYARRLRDVTAAKVEQFTVLFYELASSFASDVSKERKEDEDLVHQMISEVMQQSCYGCKNLSKCWDKNVMRTFQGMTDLMTLVEMKGNPVQLAAPREWAEYCIHPERVLSVIQDEYSYYEQSVYWKDKVKESRRLVSEQLTGMAEVMEKLADEIRHETQVQAAQEEQIHEALEELGVSIQRVDIISLEEGRVEIEVIMPHQDALDECRKLVAPLLTEIVGEPIAVFRKVVQDRAQSAVITLGSAQRFTLKAGVATVAKGGGFVSGDSYCYMSLGTGKYAVALSDGMGNGERAQEESSAALKLLRRLLQAGVHEERAVETVNSILSLRSTDEMFATIDLAMIDLNTAHARFMKIGSTPGFIKRGKEVLTLFSSNPPIGILNEIDVDAIEMKLEVGDMLIMVTDGIYDAPGHTVNKDLLMKRLISEIDTKDPQGFADCLLEKVVRQHGGQILDDMTVIVAKLERYVPEWSTIRLAGLSRIERPKMA
ncbi:stage II sporulation protein E [Thermoflavimicrobium daqui]|uniref:Stage II sporulation protein E n=1 Tax=Thermoflavimicrobium daqui TaxID=2137476 RepID=A0A364K383_9BACL|nr:stage II sporulation protein E [Thermoflavimicrobium daqui]RAL23186.1 stage II sporulation protein E [Thermoflavimicrobium daqui]